MIHVSKLMEQRFVSHRVTERIFSAVLAALCQPSFIPHIARRIIKRSFNTLAPERVIKGAKQIFVPSELRTDYPASTGK